MLHLMHNKPHGKGKNGRGGGRSLQAWAITLDAAKAVQRKPLAGMGHHT